MFFRLGFQRCSPEEANPKVPLHELFAQMPVNEWHEAELHHVVAYLRKSKHVKIPPEFLPLIPPNGIFWKDPGSISWCLFPTQHTVGGLRIRHRITLQIRFQPRSWVKSNSSPIWRPIWVYCGHLVDHHSKTCVVFLFAGLIQPLDWKIQSIQRDSWE